LWAFAGPAESLALFEGKTAGQALAGIDPQPMPFGPDGAGDMRKMGKDLLFPDGEELGDSLGIKGLFFEKLRQLLSYGAQCFRLLLSVMIGPRFRVVADNPA
jgi:hypothetical protein